MSLIMPFHRRRMAPLKSDKHEITWSNLAQDASSTQSINIIQGVASADKNSSIEVEVGSHVNAIYLEFHFSANVVTNPKVIHWVVQCKVDSVSSTVPSTYYQDERAMIIKRGMEMLPKDVGTVYKRVILVKIPPKYRRIAKNSFYSFIYICSSAEAINACGIGIYKELY